MWCGVTRLWSVGVCDTGEDGSDKFVDATTPVQSMDMMGYSHDARRALAHIAALQGDADAAARWTAAAATVCRAVLPVPFPLSFPFQRTALSQGRSCRARPSFRGRIAAPPCAQCGAACSRLRPPVPCPLQHSAYISQENRPLEDPPIPPFAPQKALACAPPPTPSPRCCPSPMRCLFSIAGGRHAEGGALAART